MPRAETRPVRRRLAPPVEPGVPLRASLCLRASVLNRDLRHLPILSRWTHIRRYANLKNA